VWEVIDAAKTKPFGFMPFYPGPGLGGHCIPIDPFYLSWKARQSGFECRFIELAGQVNGSMPEYVVQRVIDALNSVKKPLNGSSVHLFGVAYKKDVGDVRESPALDVWELLARRGAIISFTDPYVDEITVHGRTHKSVSFDDALKTPAACAVVCTDHSAFDYARMGRELSLIVDTRNVLRGAGPAVFGL
jgi:UDP-N-acetyl-D-glucosamine dehydrogenase